MKSAMGRGAAFVAAIATTLVLGFSGTALAGGGHEGGDPCKVGTAAGKGATPLNTFEFTVCQKSKDIHDASGFFQAMAAAPPPVNAIVAPRGPVTCADIKGHEASFFYPFDDKSSPPQTPAAEGILIYAFDGGPDGKGDKIGFLPLPKGASTDCSLAAIATMAPKTTAVPVTSGDIRVTEGRVEVCDPKKDAPKEDMKPAPAAPGMPHI